MNYKILGIFLIILLVTSTIVMNNLASASHLMKKKNIKMINNTKSDKQYNFPEPEYKYSSVKTKNDTKFVTGKEARFLFPELQRTIELNNSKLFKVFVYEGDYTINNGTKYYNQGEFSLKPELQSLYDQIGVKKNPQNTVVIVPVFTALAYGEPGFYTYYRKECDTSCLTAKIANYYLAYHTSGNAVKVLKLLGYDLITDIDVDKNPSILSKYDKVILLHNEYVTRKEFNSITKHPKVIYLFPNALYAEVKADYVKNTITLVRGHSYPTPDIRNGFDWKFDNTQYEYDRGCKDMYFYKIDNGYMLNCYPSEPIYKSNVLLKIIKDF